MSNPRDVPPQQQPGALPPQSNNVPPAGSAPSQPNPAPEGYGAYEAPGQAGYGQPQQGYQAPGRTRWQAPGGGMRFEMPSDRPRNFNDVLPQGGFSGMFTVTEMPTELKVSYWIWLIGGLLGLLGGVIGLFGSFVLIAIVPPLGLLVLLLVLVALALAAAQVILAMKMKEGREWARFALTIVAGISLVLAIVNASAADGRGGGSWPSFVVGLAAAVLMWLPKPQAWFAGLRGRTQ